MSAGSPAARNADEALPTADVLLAFAAELRLLENRVLELEAAILDADAVEADGRLLREMQSLDVVCQTLADLARLADAMAESCAYGTSPRTLGRVLRLQSLSDRVFQQQGRPANALEPDIDIF